MMENRESLSKDYVRGDIKHENQAFMSNLLRSELLGQSVVHITDPRMDSQIGSPARKEGSSSNLFKYRTSQVIIVYDACVYRIMLAYSSITTVHYTCFSPS